jgi:serine/threonine-protein kinase RsbW
MPAERSDGWSQPSRPAMGNAGPEFMPELTAPLPRPAADLRGEALERRTFPGRAEEVGQARHFVISALGACAAIEDAALLTSELVTNAICHTATGSDGAFEVAVQHEGSFVRVEVTDEGSETTPAPVPRSATFGSSGRGLAMVDTIAARWGYQPSGRGRSVWFELSCG